MISVIRCVRFKLRRFYPSESSTDKKYPSPSVIVRELRPADFRWTVGLGERHAVELKVEYRANLTERDSSFYYYFFESTKVIMKIYFLYAFLLASAVSGSKDDSYYPLGYSNPNVNSKMYWKDSINVLQDIDQFEKLYVQFHQCV